MKARLFSHTNADDRRGGGDILLLRHTNAYHRRRGGASESPLLLEIAALRPQLHACQATRFPPQVFLSIFSGYLVCKTG